MFLFYDLRIIEKNNFMSISTYSNVVKSFKTDIGIIN